MANYFDISEKYRAISLGQGQGPVATQLLVDAAKLGIKANMYNLYKTDVVREYEEGKDQMKYRALLFSLTFFHSVVIERKKFQNLGWNAKYHFTYADFKASVKMLQLYLNEYKDTPWDALKNAIAEVSYKNRITDEWDERLFITYYEQYFCDEACSNTRFPLSTLDTYSIPEDGPVESYVKYIHTLPSLDAAEVFGQHANAEIPYRIQEGDYLLQQMSKIQGDTFIQKEENVESQILKLIKDLKQEIPLVINEETAMSTLQDKPEPFNFILVQEIKRYNFLVKTVASSLKDLEESVTGQQKMTEQVEEFMLCIKKMEVPHEWQLAYPSLKPLGAWIQDLKLRVQQFHDWSLTGTPPIKYWLPGFISPISVLNATLLTTVKNSDVMFKELEWEYHVSTLDEAHIIEPPTEGIYVRGLHLEGAGWDKTNSILIDPEPLHLVTAMPVIHFKPVTESSMRGLYTCPCYYTSKRMNDSATSSYLFNIELKTKKPKEYWIKHGTAIIMSSKE